MYQHIRDLREDKDLSQEFVAQLLNVQATYSRYESGALDIWSIRLVLILRDCLSSIIYDNKTK